MGTTLAPLGNHPATTWNHHLEPPDGDSLNRSETYLSLAASHHGADGLYMALRNRATCLSNIANLSRSIFKRLA